MGRGVLIGGSTAAAACTGGGVGGAGSASGAAGSANTGNGGGGNNFPTGTLTSGGAGGSGKVSIRYSSTFPAAASTTGSPTITTSGGYRVYTWTSSGSITF